MEPSWIISPFMLMMDDLLESSIFAKFFFQYPSRTGILGTNRQTLNTTYALLSRKNAIDQSIFQLTHALKLPSSFVTYLGSALSP